MKDSQAQRVYAWEHSWYHWTVKNASQRELRNVIRRAERYFKIRKTQISFLTSNFNSAGEYGISRYDYNGLDVHRIVLRPYHQNIPVALHEAAHAITLETIGDEVESHGREWLGIYMWLLEKEKIAPRVALWRSAKVAGLKWQVV